MDRDGASPADPSLIGAANPLRYTLELGSSRGVAVRLRSVLGVPEVSFEKPGIRSIAQIETDASADFGNE
jgi:hypothetical protein